MSESSVDTRQGQAMTRADLLNAPASMDMHMLFRALGIGRTKGYRLLRTGELPVPVLPIGKSSYRARTADVLAYLGIDPSSAADQGGVPAA